MGTYQAKPKAKRHNMTMAGTATSLDSVPLPCNPTASVIATATYKKDLAVNC